MLPQRERTSPRHAVHLRSILRAFNACGLLQQHQSKARGGGPLLRKPPQDGPALMTHLFKGIANGTIYAQLCWYDEVLCGWPDLAELCRVVSGLRSGTRNEWLDDAALLAFDAELGSTAIILLGLAGCCTKVSSS